MAEVTASEVDDRPWRKRHPVLSRSILYALGLGLATVLAVLYLNRAEEDAATAQEALRKELSDLSLVMAIDPDGTQVLRILDEKFAIEGLPLDMQSRALRWRALAHRRGGRHTEAEAALKAASARKMPPRERLALEVEWAEARAEAGDLEGALKVLPSMVKPIDGPLGMLRNYVWAHVHMKAGEIGVANEFLAYTITRLPAPLPEGPEDYVGGRPWTPSQVATVMTELLVSRGTRSAAADAISWTRLEWMAPHDFDALLAVTRGFMALGRTKDARRSWRMARRLDPKQAAAAARSDVVLASLKDGAG